MISTPWVCSMVWLTWNEMFLPSPVVVLLTLNALAGFPVGLEFPLAAHIVLRGEATDYQSPSPSSPTTARHSPWMPSSLTP